jgi:transposase
MLMIHRARDLLVRQRTAAVNALRGHLAEFGIVAARGTAKAHELMRLAGDDERLPAMAQEALRTLPAAPAEVGERMAGGWGPAAQRLRSSRMTPLKLRMKSAPKARLGV